MQNFKLSQFSPWMFFHLRIHGELNESSPFGDVKKDIHPNCYLVLDAIFTNCSPKIVHWKFIGNSMRAPLGGCGKDIHPIECKISSLINFSQNNPLGTHWELTGSALRTSITDARSPCYHGIIECQTSCLTNQLALKRSEHIASTPPIECISAFRSILCIWHPPPTCRLNNYVPILLPLCTGDPTAIWNHVTILVQCLYWRSNYGLQLCYNFGMEIQPWTQITEQIWYNVVSEIQPWPEIMDQFCCNVVLEIQPWTEIL